MDSTSQESGNIKAIDRSSVHRICSGQVVLTLATAVKELVENSIDAGATNIEVKLKEYGSELIEVLDNGSGVKSCDYQSLTLKHHTSKIGDFSDLPGVNTFGFRGEALSSLCALSKLSITTCHRDSDVGDRLEYNHDGLILKQIPVARKVGTTVLVENLFSTLPVRHKEFCKNLKKEFGKMVQLLTAYCLISTQKRITCFNNTAKGKKTFILSTNGDATIRGNISCIYGPKQVSNLMEFVQKAPSDSILEEFNIVAVPKEDSYRIEGFLSPSTHGEGRSSSDRQFFFINGRPCDIPKVAKVINDVYHSFNRHQFPFVCLNIELLKDNMDVNVTPDKRQIFISSEKSLLATIKTSILAMYEHQPSTLKLHTLNFPKMNHVVGQSLSNSSDGDNFQDNASMSSKLKRSCDASSDVGTASPIPFKTPRLSGDMNCDGHIEQQFPSPCENDMGNHLNSNDTIGDRISSTGEGQNRVMANTPIIALTQLKNGKTHPINFAVTLPFKEDNGLNKSIKKGSVFRQSSVLKCVAQFSRESHKSYSFGVNSPSISKKTPDSLPKIQQKKQTLFPTPKKPDIDLIIQHHEQQLRHCQFNIHQNEPVPNTSETQEMELSGNDITIDATNNDDPIFIDEVRKRKRKYVQLDFQLDVIKDRLKSEITQGAKQSCENYRKFRSQLNAKDAELELSKEISKDMFSKMEIVGQFNLGFIIAKFQEDLFIIDQHATDEKYNFEVLQKETVLETQRLLNPRTLELTADSETVLLDNFPIFEKNGFKFIVSEGNTPGQRVQLVSTPVSQNWSFGKEDVDELIFMLSDNSGKMCRPSRVRQMFASRACRKSVMIGSSLSHQTMKKLVCHMGEIEQPWNCPHGRPTMRHLFNLNFLQ